MMKLEPFFKTMMEKIRLMSTGQVVPSKYKEMDREILEEKAHRFDLTFEQSKGMPSTNSSLDEWFEYQENCPDKISLKDIARMSKRGYQTVKNAHSDWLAEHGPGTRKKEK